MKWSQRIEKKTDDSALKSRLLESLVDAYHTPELHSWHTPVSALDLKDVKNQFLEGDLPPVQFLEELQSLLRRSEQILIQSKYLLYCRVLMLIYEGLVPPSLGLFRSRCWIHCISILNIVPCPKWIKHFRKKSKQAKSLKYRGEKLRKNTFTERCFIWCTG